MWHLYPWLVYSQWMCKGGRISVKYAREVAACHYVCVNAFVSVFIRQTFGIWKPARGLWSILQASLCVCLCACWYVSRGGAECIKILPGALCGETEGPFQDKTRLRSAYWLFGRISSLKNNLHIDCMSDKAEHKKWYFYNSQETNSQLLWHIWLCEYESFVAKLWLQINLTD